MGFFNINNSGSQQQQIPYDQLKEYTENLGEFFNRYYNNPNELINSITYVTSGRFSGCSQLESISLPNCTSIGSYAFYSCSSLTNVLLPECTSIGSYAFQRCSSLTDISLPNCTSIGSNAFQACTSLSKITLSKMCSIDNSTFGSNLSTMPNMRIYVPNSLYTSYCNDYSTAIFSDCFVSY